MNMDPTIGDKLNSVSIMGGNIHGIGNVAIASEFNFYGDPEAAYVVLDRLPPSCKGTIISWECSMKNFFSADKIGLVHGKSKLGDFLYPRMAKMRGSFGPYHKIKGPDSNNLMCICDLLPPVALLHPYLIAEKGI